MSARPALTRLALVPLLVLAGAAGVHAQAPDRDWWAVDLNQPAILLMQAAGQPGTARVGVFPIATEDAGLLRVADSVTEQLVWALQAVPHAGPREIEALPRPSGTGRFDARPPLDLNDAVRAGREASARYIVVGRLVQSRTQLPSHIDVEIVDVRTGQSLGSADAPFTFPPAVRSTEITRPIWRSKPFVASMGTLAAAATAFAAWRANERVNERRDALLAVPAGATAEWDRLHGEAQSASRERDFWWGVTIGLAGVTTSYVILKDSSAAVSPFPSPGSGPAGRGHWRIAIHTRSPQISVARSF
jgi:hypothetical protein